MNNEIIVVKQLPVITEQLQTIKADVTQRTKEAMSFVCTEETVKELKKIRAVLNAERKQWEGKRKTVKQAIMAPYLQFEAVYKDCVTDVYDACDADLKNKIDSVEDNLKEQKYRDVYFYYLELCKANGLDFITFDQVNINVTLSESTKSLKEKVKAFIDRICDDLRLIETQEHKEEILFEYKDYLNVSAAITAVTNRHKAIEAARVQAEERKDAEQARQEAAAKVEAVAEKLAPPVVKEPEKVFSVQFTVKGTKAQLRALKEFLNSGGYEYK